MRSRYIIRDPNLTYFITSTIVEWLPVFTTAACCDILVKSLLHCREHKALQIHAWVIMDNHFHAILTSPDLASILADFKRFTARALLEQIKAEKRDWLLNQLAYYCAAHKKESSHQIWQEGVHPQAITDEGMMQQKWDYVHENPVKRGWVAAPEHWRYSSAHEWLPAANPAFTVIPGVKEARATELRGQARAQIEFGHEEIHPALGAGYIPSFGAKENLAPIFRR